MPSSTLPSRTKATIENARNTGAPPGRRVMSAARSREKPDWVSDQATAVAEPMMNRIAPDSAAVSTSMRPRRSRSK